MRTGDIHNRCFIARRFDTSALEDEKPRDAQTVFRRTGVRGHQPEEKTRVQSFNDFIVFGMVAVGSLLSGSVLTAYGWSTVLWASFIPLALAVAVLFSLLPKVRAGRG